MSPSPIQVAVIEDHQPTRRLIVEWLNATEGLECVADFGEVMTALDDLPSKSPEVILLDINLPVMNGVDGARQLKPLLPDTQIVMLTVYEDSEHVFEALAAGATGYLLKETPGIELLQAIREVHAGGSPMSSHIARKVVQRFQQKPSSSTSASILSPREMEVLQLLSRGYIYKEIADSTRLSVATVATYIRRIYEKLHVRSRTEAISSLLKKPIFSS